MNERERQDMMIYPYEVHHPESEHMPPKFRTWASALAAQKMWNTQVPGHKARKRKPNAEAHGRAVARTVQPLVGHSDSGAE